MSGESLAEALNLKETNRSSAVYSRPCDPRRYALSVLNMALGGGVSSRLFQRLREREALVYSVGSFAKQYSDSGLLGVYLVTDHRKLGQCKAVLREELDP